MPEIPWHLPIGVWIGVLGLMALLLPLWREKPHKLERGVWTLLTALCLYMEVRSINFDALEQRQKLDDAACHQQESFSNIATDITNAADASSKQYDDTIAEIGEGLNASNRAAVASRNAANISETNLEAVSGEGSIPCVVPDSLAMTPDSVPLTIRNRGINVLTGVQVEIYSTSDRRAYIRQRVLGDQPLQDIGTLPYRWPKQLRSLQPQVGPDGIANYQAEIWTQNGFYTEWIGLRKAAISKETPGTYWAYSFAMMKQSTPEQMRKKLPPGIPKNATAAIPMPDCMGGWTDRKE